MDAEGKTLALFNVDGAFYALDNACSHRGGPLGRGRSRRHGGRVPVACLALGREDGRQRRTIPAVKMACFPVSVDGGRVFVELP